jgi:hypothetical protein
MSKNLSDALGVEHNVSENKEVDFGKDVGNEIIPYSFPEEPEEPIDTNKDQEDDYRLARRVLRNLIVKGNDAIEEISQIARQNESARGYEVVSTLIKTVADTTKDLYNVQKMTKDLKGPDPDSDPRKKSADAGNINVEQAVFVGSAAELLDAIKKKKEQDGPNSLHISE